MNAKIGTGSVTRNGIGTTTATATATEHTAVEENESEAKAKTGLNRLVVSQYRHRYRILSRHGLMLRQNPRSRRNENGAVAGQDREQDRVRQPGMAHPLLQEQDRPPEIQEAVKGLSPPLPKHVPPRKNPTMPCKWTQNQMVMLRRRKRTATMR